MDIVEAKIALVDGRDVRRSSWKPDRLLRLRDGVLFPVHVDVFGHRAELQEERFTFEWEDVNANDWEVALTQSDPKSICDHPVWSFVRPFFGERPHELRGLEVRGLPRDASLRLQQIVLPCCACGKPVNVFRRRMGANWSDLYFSPACRSTDSPGCSRGMECRDEFDRIRFHLLGTPVNKAQLGLF